MQEPSIFSRIIRGEIPAHTIYEDDAVVAFLDVHPQMEGHTLVVPRTQVDQIWDLSESDYQNLWTAVKKIGAHLKEKTGAPRIGIVVEGFGVPHVHVHLIPIYRGEDLKKPQDLTSEPDHTALAQLAETLRFS